MDDALRTSTTKTTTDRADRSLSVVPFPFISGQLTARVHGSVPKKRPRQASGTGSQPPAGSSNTRRDRPRACANLPTGMQDPACAWTAPLGTSTRAGSASATVQSIPVDNTHEDLMGKRR